MNRLIFVNIWAVLIGSMSSFKVCLHARISSNETQPGTPETLKKYIGYVPPCIICFNLFCLKNDALHFETRIGYTKKTLFIG